MFSEVSTSKLFHFNRYGFKPVFSAKVGFPWGLTWSGLGLYLCVPADDRSEAGRIFYCFECFASPLQLFYEP